MAIAFATHAWTSPVLIKYGPIGGSSIDSALADVANPAGGWFALGKGHLQNSNLQDVSFHFSIVIGHPMISTAILSESVPAH
jgi:hypothetical protein